MVTGYIYPVDIVILRLNGCNHLRNHTCNHLVFGCNHLFFDMVTALKSFYLRAFKTVTSLAFALYL